MRFELTSELATDNPAIDQQHDRIFQLLTELYEAVVQEKGRTEIGRILASVSVFVIAHFRMEESLMEASGYPQRVAHRQDHDFLGIQVESLVDRFHEERLVPQDFLDFMKIWLDKHVVQHDLPMARFVQGQARPLRGNGPTCETGGAGTPGPLGRGREGTADLQPSKPDPSSSHGWKPMPRRPQEGPRAFG